MSLDVLRFINSLLDTVGDMIVSNIKWNIKRDLFSEKPFGAPLKDSTLESKSRRKRPSTALIDSGGFLSGMTYTKGFGSIKVDSTGLNSRAKEAIVFGNSNMPPRDPFTEELPHSGGKTIGEHTADYVGDKLEAYIDKQIEQSIHNI